jgi:tetratricopeptide (TPR) repeat protein
MSKKAMGTLLFCMCLSSCFKKHPVNENALLHQRACIESIELKDYARAGTHCELCLEFDASMPECLNGIGLIAFVEKDEDKAKAFFTKALRQDNDFSQARNNLGVIYFSHGDFETALRYFDRALEIDPSNTDARYNCGLSNFRIGQRLRAKGDRRSSLKRMTLAKVHIKKLLAIEPTFSSAYRDLGLIELNRYDLSDYEDKQKDLLMSAMEAFLLCKEANLEDDGCYEGLGQVFFEEGKFDKSLANYFLCLTYAPTNSACRNGIVMAYEKSAHTEGGYQSYVKMVDSAPADAIAHEAFCAALFERGLDEEGARECEIALRLKPDLCTAHFRLASYFSSIFNAERASKYCQAFLACGAQSHHLEVERCQEILATLRR